MSDMSRSALEDGPDDDRNYLVISCPSCQGSGIGPALKFSPAPDPVCAECIGEGVIEVHKDDVDPEWQDGAA